MVYEFILVGLILSLAFAAYYALVLFPRQRSFVKRQQLARSLARGDEVITYGGVIGRVVEVNADEGIAHVELAEGVVVRVVNASIVSRYDPVDVAENARQSDQ
jgi:preprotein translocase subunit YajC